LAFNILAFNLWLYSKDADVNTRAVLIENVSIVKDDEGAKRLQIKFQIHVGQHKDKVGPCWLTLN
jgi:hypothetical protein